MPPVRVERVLLRPFHRGLALDLRAALPLREPADELVSVPVAGRKPRVVRAEVHVVVVWLLAGAVEVEVDLHLRRGPVRVERVVLRPVHRRRLVAARASVGGRVPSVERVPVPRRHGQLSVLVVVPDRLRRDGAFAAVRVERDRVGKPLPVRVERLPRCDRDDGLGRNLVAAVRLREPALERVAVARRRRKLPVGLPVCDVLVGRRRRSAVRVEVDPVRPRAQLRVDHVVVPDAGRPLLRVAQDVGERDRAGRCHPDRRVVHVDRVRPREVCGERVPSVERVAGDGGGRDGP